MNLHAMRMGPGKHLKGLTLMGGIVKPEEVSVDTRDNLNDSDTYVLDSSTTSTR